MAPPGRQRGHRLVVAPVLAVHVVHQVGGQAGVVLRRVENRAFLARTALDDDAPERLAPQLLGPGAHGIEIEFGNLLQRILAGIFGTHGRETHGCGERRRPGGEGQHRLPVTEQLDRSERLREAGPEPHLVVGHPPLRAAHARELGGPLLPQGAQIDALVRNRVHEIHDHAPRAVAVERIAVHARTGCGSQLDRQPLVGQFDRVVAARGRLPVVREGVGLLQEGAVAHHLLAGGGMEEDVGQVGTSRTAQVGMRESVDGPVVVVVAGAGIPVARPRVGAELHHAERRGGTGKGMSVEARADERIDILERIGRLCTGDAGARQQGENQGSLHGLQGQFLFRLYKYRNTPRTRLRRFASLGPHITQNHPFHTPPTASRSCKRNTKIAQKDEFSRKKANFIPEKPLPPWHASSF